MQRTPARECASAPVMPVATVGTGIATAVAVVAVALPGVPVNAALVTVIGIVIGIDPLGSGRERGRLVPIDLTGRIGHAAAHSRRGVPPRSGRHPRLETVLRRASRTTARSTERIFSPPTKCSRIWRVMVVPGEAVDPPETVDPPAAPARAASAAEAGVGDREVAKGITRPGAVRIVRSALSQAGRPGPGHRGSRSPLTERNVFPHRRTPRHDQRRTRPRKSPASARDCLARCGHSSVASDGPSGST
jgi:hypothetical protein